jgi:hypothetical protein
MGITFFIDTTLTTGLKMYGYMRGFIEKHWTTEFQQKPLFPQKTKQTERVVNMNTDKIQKKDNANYEERDIVVDGLRVHIKSVFCNQTSFPIAMKKIASRKLLRDKTTDK